MAHEFKTTEEMHYFDNQDFELVRGDSRDIVVILSTIDVEKLEDQLGERYTTLQTIPADSDLEEPFDLTNAVVKMMVRKTDLLSTVLISKSSLIGSQIVIVDPPNGRVEIYFVPTDTQDLDVGEYFFDIQVDTQDGKRYTPVKGKLYLVGDVTR